MLVLLNRILQISGKKNLKDVWPNLEVYFHGGVSFTPYKNQFAELFSNEKVSFLQLYNASEGFFGIQDMKDSHEMLLMLDYGVFYEFIPIEEEGKANPLVLSLSEVKIGKVYSLVISTNAGLWRYKLGDTIEFCEGRHASSLTKGN